MAFLSKQPVYKLGKLPPKIDSRTLKLSLYKKIDLCESPNEWYWNKKITLWPMFMNDVLGCCTITTAGHMIQEWTTYTLNAPFIVSNQDIIKSYSDVSGYNPVTKTNDNGAVVLDVLKYWRNTGIGGRKITGFASVDFKNSDMVKDVIWLFGSLYIGVSLPNSAKQQRIWTVPFFGPRWAAQKGSWGGHATNIVAYDKDYLYCVTWGEIKKMSWDFFNTYVDEAYAILSKDWISDAKKKAPNNYDWDSLQSDLNKL